MTTLAQIQEHLDKVHQHCERASAAVAKLNACNARADEAHARIIALREQMALDTANRAALQALEGKFHTDESAALNEGGLHLRAAHEALAAAKFEQGRIDILVQELYPEPPLTEQNRYARRIDGRLTAGERREALERRIASGVIPAERADAARQLLEREMADEAKKAARRRRLLNQTLRALNA